MKSNLYVALLRGINVGGKNKLPMKELIAVFEEAGAQNCRTYIQSGNIVFQANATLARRLPDSTAKIIAESSGFNTHIVMRTAGELEKIVDANPYAKSADSKSLHVGFLADRPKPKNASRLDYERSKGDEFTLIGREIYLHLPHGVAKTKLTNAYFDSTLQTMTTVRNWNTTCRLLEMTKE